MISALYNAQISRFQISGFLDLVNGFEYASEPISDADPSVMIIFIAVSLHATESSLY